MPNSFSKYDNISSIIWPCGLTFFVPSTADYCSQRYYKTSSEGEFQWCIPCLWINGHRSKSDYTVQPIIDWWPLPGWHLSSSCNYSTINILIRHCIVYEFQQQKMLLSKRFTHFIIHFLLSRFIIILKSFSHVTRSKISMPIIILWLIC